MQRVQITKDLSFSRLIYGMWRLGDDTDRSTDHVVAKVQACLDQGITTFDQADIYGDYESELILGEALQADPSLRAQMEIITKCDICLLSDKFRETRVKHYDTSAEHIRASVDQSLQNMNIEQIDCLLLHRPDPLMNAAETGAALDGLVKAGKVRTLGVSNFHPWDWRHLQDHMETRLVTNQIEINPLTLDGFVNGDLAEIQRDKMIPQAWSPLAGGQLFADTSSPVAARLAELADREGLALDTMLIAWLLRHPAQICPVVGTNNLERIASLHIALEAKIDRQLWFEIYEAGLGSEVP